MKKYSVLISGISVCQDTDLINSFKKHTRVLQNCDNRQIDLILSPEKIDIIILEIQKEKLDEIEIIKTLKAQHQQVHIILINGDREVLARAINYGIKDVFRKPYKKDMLVERVNALLNSK